MIKNTGQERVQQITLEEEFKKNPECPVENFYTLRNWVDGQNHLPKISGTVGCFYIVEKTQKCIEAFYEIKTSAPELYRNRDISDPDLQKALTYTTTFTLPILTPEKKYRITYLSIDEQDSSNFDFYKSAKLLLMAYDAELYIKGTARGHVIILDLKNVGFRHIMKCGLDGWKKIIRLTQEALPVRKKMLHILNTNYFIYKFAQVLKPFIAPEVFRTIHLHRSNELEEFYKHIPKECLPLDYGGSLDSVASCKKRFEEDLWRLRDFFNEDDKLVIKK